MTGHTDRVIMLDEAQSLADTDPSAILARLAAASRKPNLMPLPLAFDPRLAAVLSTAPLPGPITEDGPR